MAEANHRLAQSPTIRITTAAHCLAMLRSRNAVKDELRKHGLKASAPTQPETSACGPASISTTTVPS